MRCNAVIDNLGLKPVTPGNPTNTTEYNYLYNSSSDNFSAPTNELFMTAAQSNNADYCYWRRRWTAPELVCIPFGSTTSASPHVAAATHCNPDLGAAFGIKRIVYPTAQPCSDGLDDDGDGQIDFDGGASANHGTALAARDTGCTTLQANRESGNCGLGAELVFVLWALRRIDSRR